MNLMVFMVLRREIQGREDEVVAGQVAGEWQCVRQTR